MPEAVIELQLPPLQGRITGWRKKERGASVRTKFVRNQTYFYLLFTVQDLTLTQNTKPPLTSLPGSAPGIYQCNTSDGPLHSYTKPN